MRYDRSMTIQRDLLCFSNFLQFLQLLVSSALISDLSYKEVGDIFLSLTMHNVPRTETFPFQFVRDLFYWSNAAGCVDCPHLLR